MATMISSDAIIASQAGRWGLPRPAVEQQSRFAWFPVKVSREGRDALLAAYPALSYHQHSAAYLRLAEYLIYSTYEDKEARLVVPAAHVSDLVRGRAIEGQRWFSARAWLDAFSRDVWQLDVREYDHLAGEARSVGRDLPAEVQEILAAEPLGEMGEEGQVWFATGVPVTKKRIYAEAATYTATLRELAAGVASDHPARGLMEYLNGQPQTTVGKIVRGNWGDVMRAFAVMEEGTRKESARATLLVLRDYCRLIYAASDKTPRLHALGPTIHSLPRELRKAALGGCVSLDARSCQLAVVARLWHVPGLLAFLAGGGSIWAELQRATGTTKDEKPALKTALYSITFGMGEKAVRENLSAKMGMAPAAAYLEHPLIRELLRARQARLREIRREKRVVDAWGKVIVYDARRARLRSLLAQEVQSWEVRLMVALLPVLEAERDLAVVSWLHDGLTVKVSDQRQEARIVSRLRSVFGGEAVRLGLVTELEVG
jgi:hypothetical protein